MKAKPTVDRRSRSELERVLRQRRDQLRAALRESLEQQRRDPGHRPADAAAATLDHEIRASLVNRQQRQVALIEAALDRLRRGEYGRCQDCARPIELKRLRALPFAQRCTRCQATTEARERRPARRPAASPGAA